MKVYGHHKYKLSFVSCKVEKIVKGSLDLIPSPSPSVEIQILLEL